MASPQRSAAVQALREALAGVVALQGADLEDVEVTAAGRRSRVRVVVDADQGIDLDAIAAISQAVSTALDDPDTAGAAFEAVSSGPYTLEVTSPGVDRPLTMPRHWRRNVSRLVEITPADAPKGDPAVVGRIRSSTEVDVTVDVDGDERVIPLASIAHATVRIEFTRPEDRE